MDASPAPESRVAGAQPETCHFRLLDRDALAKDETVLSRLFGLLVLAHGPWVREATERVGPAGDLVRARVGVAGLARERFVAAVGHQLRVVAVDRIAEALEPTADGE